ncbi:MAG: hypothetical protein M5U34_18990 [Chloroflexi bacterium]|nr:hypothetical protein [Chloroflexota bacterium]
MQTIYHEILALGPINADGPILPLAKQCQRALRHAIDRLDDLAGTPFTQQAGQAAYDSLPWLEAETLGRHVLAELPWGAQLAQRVYPGPGSTAGTGAAGRYFRWI